VTTYKTRLETSALILNVAALYVEQHGYLIPLADIDVEDPEPCWGVGPRWDLFDQYSPTPATPAATARGAIAFIAFGGPVVPFKDDTDRFDLYDLAFIEVCRLYANDPVPWVFAHEAAAGLRAAAVVCELKATQCSALDAED
jgi:hypothetical protein